jgi:putative hydrolase of the HAD superfamily
MPIRGVLFDIDETLFDASGAQGVALAAHLRAEGLLERFANVDAAVELWQEVLDAEYERFLAGELTFVEQRRARARSFMARVGDSTPMSDEDATAWFGRFQSHRHALRVAFPDAGPVLGRLKPAFRLGVVSNSELEHQRAKLEQIGLLHYFGAAMVCSQQHGEPKPAASIFHAGCAAIGLDPGEVAYVGDNYLLDGLGAKEAGLAAFWLDRARTGRAVEPGVRVIHSLDELPDALGERHCLAPASVPPSSAAR